MIEGDAWGSVTCMNEKCRARPTLKWFSEKGTRFCQRTAIRLWNRRF